MTADSTKPYARPPRRPRRAGDVVRAGVIAISTLAILLVCFSIYQHQADRATDGRQGPLPVSLPPELDRSASTSAEGVDPKNTPSVRAGPVAVGPGRDIKLTLFRPHDDRSWGEIAVQEWTPVAGSEDEFSLTRPEFRMRTRDGHGVLVTADEATLEARPRAGLEVRRGRLKGNVVVDYDRLTMEERQSLPPERRGEVRSEEIVRIQTEELSFDVEFSQLSVPVSLEIKAVDAEFSTTGLEMRFDQTQGRVEYIRIDRGGRLKLLEQQIDPVLALSGEEQQRERRRDLVAWIRESIQTQLAAAAKREAAALEAAATPPKPRPAFDEDGTPIIYLDEEPAAPASGAQPPRYYARFEEGVDARRLRGESIEARLQAEVLEVVRMLTLEERERKEPEKDPRAVPKPAGEPAAEGRIELAWNGRLIVRTCTDDDAVCADAGSSLLLAEGDPVRILDDQGEAQCQMLRFDADRNQLVLAGAVESPVEVRSSHGVLAGINVRWDLSGERFRVEVDGPGRIERSGSSDLLDLNELSRAEGHPTQAPGSAEKVVASGAVPSTIRFSRTLRADGARVPRTKVDWQRRQWVERRCMAMETARIDGEVRLLEGEAEVHAAAMDVRFAPPNSDCEQAVEHVSGRGDVLLKQGEDRLTCGSLDLALVPDAAGRFVPSTATLVGDIEATQSGRTIRAREELIADFEVVEIEAPPLDALGAYRAAVAEGLDPNTVDWAEFRQRHGQRAVRELGMRGLQAAGEVYVTDPEQGLDVRAERIDAGFARGREIERVRVIGTESEPATMATENWSVTGADVRVDLPADEAEVAGPGRMTFRSYKDLDGRESAEPVPIAVQWSRWMRYRGAENRAVYSGEVHATSASQTTFDCPGELILEFKDADLPAVVETPAPYWSPIRKAWQAVRPADPKDRDVTVATRFGKKLTYVLANGGARVHTVVLDKATGELSGRATLSGPKLSLDLRPEVTKMLIEGPGELLLEDFRPAASSAAPALPGATPLAAQPGLNPLDDRRALGANVGARRSRGSSPGLLNFDADSGPSKTLIEWKEYLRYDYAIEQTRFEGNVRLTHFSGSALDQLLGKEPSAAGAAPRGRRTFLSSDVLTADFLDRREPSRASHDQQLGDLSASRLRQFRAVGNVSLQDETEGLDVTCSDLIYERLRQILFIQGMPNRRSTVTMHRPGQGPRQFSSERFVYDLEKGVLEVRGPAFQGR